MFEGRVVGGDAMGVAVVVVVAVARCMESHDGIPHACAPASQSDRATWTTPW